MRYVEDSMFSDFSDSNVTSVNLSLLDEQINEGLALGPEAVTQTKLSQAQSKFKQFIRQFENDEGEFPYREQLKAHYDQGDYYLLVDLDDLYAFDPDLRDDFRQSPARYLPRFEHASRQVVAALTIPRPDLELMPRIQIQFNNYSHYTRIRDLSARNVSELVAVRGIITSAGFVRIKATSVKIMCRNCRQEKTIYTGTGFGGAVLPKYCDTPVVPNSGLVKCPPNPYLILGDDSSYIDVQKSKLQENPEFVPTGEMPRHIDLSFERYLARTKPGSLCNVVGIYQTYQRKGKGRDAEQGKDVGIRVGYIRVLGFSTVDRTSDDLNQFTPEEVDDIHKMSQMSDLYGSISRSIAPTIFGHDDIKKAIACMLFGGSRKHLPDGLRLRGDVNVLLIGDPSLGKSQFLKFAHKLAPIAVYTSGKGSSAAGLTASVIRDPQTGDFRLEGGALVLADCGLVCIDEFDKMRESDRVAIHEAMEQQTISIAKAGITTILNSRTSILAAANPRFGRYDDMKDPVENIDFQTTILSRFDMIFIMRDTQDYKKDVALAKHIIGVHQKKAIVPVSGQAALSVEKLKKYCAYARQTCKPRLSPKGAEVLRNRYVAMRKLMADQSKKDGGKKAVIPITVRQLEAIIRLSESLAKMELSNEANANHVNEALRLFRVSTLLAATASFGDGGGGAEFKEHVKRAEGYLERRIAIGMTVSYERVKLEMMKKNVAPENAITQAINFMAARGTLNFKNMRRQITRTRA